MFGCHIALEQNNRVKWKLGAALILLVVAPVALLAWLGALAAGGAPEAVRRNFREVLTARLDDAAETVAVLMQERERDLAKALDSPPFPDLPKKDGDVSAEFTRRVRELTRANPLVKQFFALRGNGSLLHPPPSGDLNDGERQFLTRARRVLIDREWARNVRADTSSPNRGGQGWSAWHWDEGLHLIFWRVDSEGRVAGAEVEVARLAADIVARLPSTSGDAKSDIGCTLVRDENGWVLYQWGSYEPPEKEKPAAERLLNAPLQTWRLEYHMPASSLESALQGGRTFNFAAGLLFAAAALAGLALYLYRGYTSELREAAQRVSFVNQVTHELKTPLTNIRMYAELLETRLNEDEHPDAHALRHLNVIVDESGRLSRLIANVLTFARSRRGPMTLHKSEGCIDETVRSTLEQFRPALAEKNVRIDFTPCAPKPAGFDADALRQILGNLAGNVEKYAASGGVLLVSTTKKDGRVEIVVEDHGPGIPSDAREKVFDPFFRLSDALDSGAAGAGIGLTIARDLARLHGGDLTLEESARGAKFKVVISADTVRTVQPEGCTPNEESA